MGGRRALRLLLAAGGLTTSGLSRLVAAAALGLALVACTPAPASPTAPPTELTVQPTEPAAQPPQPAPTPSPAAIPTVPQGLVPKLGRVFLLILENREFNQVIGNPSAPNYNRWAGEGALLTADYAITHPSLPNYLALIGGDTFGIRRNCEDCYQDAPSLPDQLEAGGRDWRAYLEGMPGPCYDVSLDRYAKRHNPFMYFLPIRGDPERCRRHVVPFTGFEADLAAGAMPDFVWITPDLCHGAHDCLMPAADAWLGRVVEDIRASPAYAPDSLIILTWDEGTGNGGCCGLAAGGRVATVLLSPLVVAGTQSDIPYTHYSLLATLEDGWGLSRLGHAADAATAVIQGIWR